MRLAALVLAVSLFACARKPSAGPADASVEDLGPIDWQTFAFNGVAIVTSHGDGQTCVVTCEGRGGKLRWRRDECVAGRNDLRFISPDCEVLLVLKDAPPVRDSIAASPVGAVWRGTNVETPVRLHQVANAERGVKLSDSGKWFGWLAGTLEYEGAKPRYSTSGQGVEFESLDGEHHALTFDELARWVDRLPDRPAVVDAGTATAATPGPMALFRWTGDDGVEHIGTEDQIPAKFRARAKPIQAELAVVRAEAIDAGVRDGGVDAGVDAGLPPVNQCTVWREKLSAIERELSALQPPEECPLEAVKLQNGTAPLGAEERARCRATRDDRLKAYEAQKAKLESDRASAQDALRRAQVGGC